MRLLFDGVVYGGTTATREDVVVTVTATALRVERPEGVEWWTYDELRQTRGHHHGEPVRLELGADESAPALVVEDPELVAAIRSLAVGALPAHLGGPRRVYRAIAVAAAGAVAVAGLLYFVLIPAMANAVADRVPVSWEEQLGSRMATAMAPEAARCGDPLVRETLEGIVARLQAARPASRYTYRVAVSRDAALNAFAAPGGYLVVNAGLLRHTARAEEVAGVMAHELAHVELRHGTRAILRDVPLRILLAAMGGDASGLSAVLAAAGDLGALRYRRADEAAADAEGLRMLRDAGMDPSGLAGFFRTLQREEGDGAAIPGYLSTHPRTADRLARLESADSGAPTMLPLATPQPWAALAQRCGS